MLPLKLYPLFYGLQDPVELSFYNLQVSINLIIMQNLLFNCKSINFNIYNFTKLNQQAGKLR